MEANYLEWERTGRTRGVGRTFARGQFAGPQQHAHNDYLEALVERGIPGLVTLLLMVAAPVICAARLAPRQENDRLTPGAASAIAGLAAVAAVDYPLARPDELIVFWTAVAILTLARSEDT